MRGVSGSPGHRAWGVASGWDGGPTRGGLGPESRRARPGAGSIHPEGRSPCSPPSSGPGFRAAAKTANFPAAESKRVALLGPGCHSPCASLLSAPSPLHLETATDRLPGSRSQGQKPGLKPSSGSHWCVTEPWGWKRSRVRRKRQRSRRRLQNKGPSAGLGLESRD